MMKKFAALLLSASVVMSLAACGGSNNSSERTLSVPENATEDAGTSETKTEGTEPVETNEDSEPAKESGKTDEGTEAGDATAENGTKILVAYFSATGNTKALAEYAADALNADLYEIIPEEPYTDDDLNYNDRSSRATVEQNDSSARPVISGSVENMEQYEVVFLAYAGGIIGLN